MGQETLGQALYGWQSAESTTAHSYVLPAIMRLLPTTKPLTVLDVGCGNGYTAAELAALGHDVIGLDASRDGIAIARQAYPRLRFEVHSAYDDLREIIAAVDVVVASEVVEHLYRPKLFFENVFKVLKPGGIAVVTTPYHGYLKNLALSLLNLWDKHHTVDWEGGHVKFFSEKTLTSMMESCGFTNITYHNTGRLPGLWKSMVGKAERPSEK